MKNKSAFTTLLIALTLTTYFTAFASDIQITVKTDITAASTNTAASAPAVKDPIDTPVVNAAIPVQPKTQALAPVESSPKVTGTIIGPCLVGDTDSYNATTDDQPNKVGLIGVACEAQKVKAINTTAMSNLGELKSAKFYASPSQEPWIFSPTINPDVLQPSSTGFSNFNWMNHNGTINHYNSLTLPVNKIAGATFIRQSGLLRMQITEGVDTTSPLRYGTSGFHTGVIELVVGPRTGFMPAITVTDYNNVKYTLASYRKAACPVYAVNSHYVARWLVEEQHPWIVNSNYTGIVNGAIFPYQTFASDTVYYNHNPYAGYTCAPENY